MQTSPKPCLHCTHRTSNTFSLTVVRQELQFVNLIHDVPASIGSRAIRMSGQGGKFPCLWQCSCDVQVPWHAILGNHDYGECWTHESCAEVTARCQGRPDCYLSPLHQVLVGPSCSILTKLCCSLVVLTHEIPLCGSAQVHATCMRQAERDAYRCIAANN